MRLIPMPDQRLVAVHVCPTCGLFIERSEVDMESLSSGLVAVHAAAKTRK